MRDANRTADDENAALAEELDAETLQAIAARHDDYADREAAIADLIDPREGARSVYPEDDIVRDIYAALELHKIDDTEIVADLCHAAANVGDSLEGTRRDDIRWAADRRMNELCNDEMEPLVTPDEEPTREEVEVDRDELADDEQAAIVHVDVDGDTVAVRAERDQDTYGRWTVVDDHAEAIRETVADYLESEHPRLGIEVDEDGEMALDPEIYGEQNDDDPTDSEDETAAGDDHENAEANQPLYDVCEFARLGDDKTGRRYLDQLSDRAITRTAADRGVREDDLRRALYALGRCLPHDEMRREARGEYPGDEDTVRYEADEYLVDASEHYHNTLSDLLSREFDDLEAAEADMEASGYSPDEVANFDAEAAAEHYRDRLRSAMTAVMEQADKTDYDHPAYPCSYPMVILRDDDRLTAEEARDLAEQMVEERTEVKTRPTWEGTRTVGIDRPAAREVAEDVAARVQGATVYTEEESQILTRNGGPDGREVLDTVYEVAIVSLADGEVAIYPGGQDVELRDADNGGDAR